MNEGSEVGKTSLVYEVTEKKVWGQLVDVNELLVRTFVLYVCVIQRSCQILDTPVLVFL